MKLVFFDDFKLGVLKSENVVDIGQAVRDIVHTSPQNLISQLIADFAKYRGPIDQLVGQSQGVPVSQVRRNNQLPLAADIHGPDAFVPAFDHPPGA